MCKEEKWFHSSCLVRPYSPVGRKIEEGLAFLLVMNAFLGLHPEVKYAKMGK